MSHCLACDRLLTDKEAKRKYKSTDEEIGLCDHCLDSTNEAYSIPTVDPEYELENPYEYGLVNSNTEDDVLFIDDMEDE